MRQLLRLLSRPDLPNLEARTPADWPPGDFPLGVWVADCRRHCNAGRMDTNRATQLKALGMVWSYFDAGFEEGLSAAAAWADEHGAGLAAPVDAVHGEYPVGRWLKNQRAAARRAAEVERCRAEGLSEPKSSATPLSDERRQALDEIDSGWCPAWSIDWQRAFRLAWPSWTAKTWASGPPPSARASPN